MKVCGWVVVFAPARLEAELRAARVSISVKSSFVINEPALSIGSPSGRDRPLDSRWFALMARL